MVEQLVAGKAEQRSDHRAERVHRAVETEHPSARRLVDVRNQQRVAGRAAKSLAEPVDHPARQHPRPRGRRCHHHLAQRRHAVAGGDQRSTRESVAEWSGRQLGQRRRTLRRAFHGADHRRRRAEHRRQVDRQQRIQQFTGGVLEERHRGEHPDIAGEPTSGGGRRRRHLADHAWLTAGPRRSAPRNPFACPRARAARTKPTISPCTAAATNASRVDRFRSWGSGGSSSDGLIRCQISVKILPASSPPTTLLTSERGLYKALAALTAVRFPSHQSLNPALEHVLVLPGAVHLCGVPDRPEVLHPAGAGRGGGRIPRHDHRRQRRLSLRIGLEVSVHR